MSDAEDEFDLDDFDDFDDLDDLEESDPPDEPEWVDLGDDEPDPDPEPGHPAAAAATAGPAGAAAATGVPAGPLSRARTTWLLAGLVVVLVTALAAMAGYRWVLPEPAPDADRPIVLSELSREAALAAAESHTIAILSKNHTEYAAQTARALELIVPDSAFAAEYQRTAEDLEDAFVEEQIDLEFTAVERGIVRGGPDEVQVLLYLNQYITRGGTPEETDSPIDFTPYRALVTVVPSGSGWRVLRIDTQ